jgi:hypothetical protein
MSADRAFAAALRSAALADAGIKSVLGDPVRLYDDPPPDPVFPYATLGAIETRNLDSSEAPALEHVLTLNVWSRHGGRAEALDVIATLRAALHDAGLSITGRNLVLLFAGASDVSRAGDGRTTQGVLRLRAITEPA